MYWQGICSVVEPHAYAISHNELYRKQIAYYMCRHYEMKPALTGWAQ